MALVGPELPHDDLGELLDRGLRRRLVEDDLAVADEIDPVARLEDVHVVVQDHDDRDLAALAQAPDEVEHQRALAHAHRRQRLVEQQDARIRVDRARDGDRLPLATREPRDGRLHPGDLDADVGDRLSRALAHRAVVEQPVRMDDLAVEEDVVEDAQLVDQRKVLVDGVDAERAGMHDGAELDRLAVEVDRPRVRLVVAGEDLDQRRLAGPVVAEQPEHLAVLEMEVDGAQGGNRTEALGHALHAQDLGHGQVSPLPPRWRSRVT
jgi:hypothetical protein